MSLLLNSNHYIPIDPGPTLSLEEFTAHIQSGGSDDNPCLLQTAYTSAEYGDLYSRYLENHESEMTRYTSEMELQKCQHALFSKAELVTFLERSGLNGDAALECVDMEAHCGMMVDWAGVVHETRRSPAFTSTKILVEFINQLDQKFKLYEARVAYENDVIKRIILSIFVSTEIEEPSWVVRPTFY